VGEDYIADDEDCFCRERCPTPHADGLSYSEYPSDTWAGIRFGFASLLQLRLWFLKPGRALLHSRDFVVGVYEAKRVLHGNKQVVFWFDGAERVNELSLEAV